MDLRPGGSVVALLGITVLVGSSVLYPGACATWVDNESLSSVETANADYDYDGLSPETQRVFDEARRDRVSDNVDAVTRPGDCPDEFTYGEQLRDYTIAANGSVYEVTTATHWGAFNIARAGQFLFLVVGMMLLVGGSAIVLLREKSTDALLSGYMGAGVVLVLIAILRLVAPVGDSFLWIGVLGILGGALGGFTGVVASSRISLAVGAVAVGGMLVLQSKSHTLLWMLGYLPALCVFLGFGYREAVNYAERRLS